MRLDLSFNGLSAIPSGISLLSGLEQLWLNDNPFLATLPASLELCKKLKVVDLRRTALAELPREMGRLKHLVEVDLRDTPFADRCVVLPCFCAVCAFSLFLFNHFCFIMMPKNCRLISMVTEHPYHIDDSQNQVTFIFLRVFTFLQYKVVALPLATSKDQEQQPQQPRTWYSTPID